MIKLAARLGSYHLKGTKALVSVAAALVFGVMLYVTGDVIGRYIFNQPLPASILITKTALVLIAFLSFGYVQATRGNIELQFLTRRFNPIWQGILDIVSPVIGLILFGLITWGALGMSLEAWQDKINMEGAYEFPIWPSQFGVAVGAFILTITFIVDIIKRTHNLLTIGRRKQKQ